jgi:hypothetical protein
LLAEGELMKPQNIVLVVIGILILLIFIAWFFNLQLLAIQATLLALLFAIAIAVGLIIMFLQKRDFSEMTSESAWNFVRDKWKQMRGEDLTLSESTCFTRYFWDRKFYGFVVNRKRGMSPIVFIVPTSPKKEIYWFDSPSPNQLIDPFYGFSPEGSLRGAPVPKIPEPGYYDDRFFRKREEPPATGVSIYNVPARFGEDEEIAKARRRRKKK